MYWDSDGNEVHTEQDEYETKLRKIQKEHLNHIKQEPTDKKPRNGQPIRWKPCVHDECPECHGTRIKLNGQFCVHFVSCSCPKCNKGY